MKEWTPEIGEILKTRLEPGNAVDRFVVAVEKVGQIFGHLNKGNSGCFEKIYILIPTCKPRKYISSSRLKEKGQLRR